MRSAILFFLTVFFVFSTDSFSDETSKVENDPQKKASYYFDALIKKLLAACPSQKEGAPLKVAMGNFPCENPGHEGISAMSGIIRTGLAEAATRNKKLKLITRERLNDLMTERKFQSMDIMDPGTSAREVKVESIDAIVRGRYFYEFPKIDVRAEIVFLNGGASCPASCKMPVSLAGSADIFPPEKIREIEQKYLFPQNVKKSKNNYESVKKISNNIPNRKLTLEIWTKSGKTDFEDGESIVFNIRASEDCCAALIAHFVDGTSTLLFPNKYNPGSFIKGGKIISVPGFAKGKQSFVLEVGAPFGGDVVQIIACDKKTGLDSLISSQVADGKSSFSQISKMRLNEAAKNAKNLVYGENFIVVNTYPKW